MTDAARRKARRTLRRRARVAAVQALYRVGLTGDDVERAIADLAPRGPGGAPMDAAFFGALARGASAGCATADPVISRALREGWRLERLSQTMRALLRVAAFELARADGTPAAVIINEYVDIAAGFFDAAGVGFANGVIDRLAREARGANE